MILDISIERAMDIKDSVKLINLVEEGLCKGYTSSVIFTNTYFTAVENKIDCIVTRNVEDYKNSVLPVYTPIELLKTIEMDQGSAGCQS